MFYLSSKEIVYGLHAGNMGGTTALLKSHRRNGNCEVCLDDVGAGISPLALCVFLWLLCVCVIVYFFLSSAGFLHRQCDGSSGLFVFVFAKTVGNKGL